MENPSIVMRIFICTYVFSSLIELLPININTTANSWGWGSLSMIWGWGSLGIIYIFLRKRPLNMILKVLLLICITLISLLTCFVLNGSELTLELLKNQVFPKSVAIIIVSLIITFWTQIAALIFDPYLEPEYKIFKATKEEFILADMLIFLLAMYYLQNHFRSNSEDLTVIGTVFKGYIIVKLLTILQTKVMQIKMQKQHDTNLRNNI